MSMALGAATAAIGDLDAAFDWLERAFEAREALPTLMYSAIPDALRADPRFAALMDRVRSSRL